MFKTLDMTKFDRGLYTNRQDSNLKNEPILGLCGSLQMALSFDSLENVLTAKLIQATNLVARRTNDSPPNPYFTVHLIPSELSSETQMFDSKRYQAVRSVMLADEFRFSIPSGNVRGCQLEVMVFDAEEKIAEHECIGCCWLSLNRVDITDDPAASTIFWAEILPLETGDEDTAGEILLSTVYSSKDQRLTVTIIKARNLTNGGDLMEPPDPCVKVTVYVNNRKLKQRRTTTKTANYHPSFNEALTFGIPKNSFCEVVLSVTVYHEPGIFRHSKILGQVDIALHKCKDLWRALIRGEESKAIWYQLESDKGYGNE